MSLELDYTPNLAISVNKGFSILTVRQRTTEDHHMERDETSFKEIDIFFFQRRKDKGHDHPFPIAECQTYQRGEMTCFPLVL